MKKIFTNIKFEKGLFVLSLYTSLYLIYNIFSGFSFALTDTSALYISQATLDGVDVSARVNLFYRVVISLAIVFPVLYFLFAKTINYIKCDADKIHTSVNVAFVGLLFIIFEVFGLASGQLIHLLFFLFLVSLLLLLFEKKHNCSNRISGTELLPYIITTSFLFYIAILFLFNSNNAVLDNLVWVYILIFILVLSSVILLQVIFGLTVEKVLSLLIPITTIPILIFLSTELVILFKIRYVQLIPYKWLFLVLTLVSIAAYFVFFYRRKHVLSKNRIESIFSLSLLVSFLLLVVYTPFIQQPTDMFEVANPANALMRVVAFHEIPFIDFMSSHMFSEQYYGLFYTLFFGYNASLDFLTYSFLTKIIFYIIAYVFLARTFENKFYSVFFLLIFPFIGEFFAPNIFIGVLAFLFILRLAKKQNVKNYLLLFYTLLCLVFWSIDVGFSSLVTSIIFFPLIFFVDRIKVEWKSLLISFSIFSASVLFLLVLFSIIRSPQYLINSFTSAIHYLKANQAHGYSEISTYYGHQFYLLHFMLPLIAVSLIFVSVFKLKSNKFDTESIHKFSLQASIFFFIVFLANFQRGLVRHGFMENQDGFLTSTFYLAIVLFLFSLVQKWDAKFKFIVFLGLSFIIVITIKYYPISQEKSKLEHCFSIDNSYAYLDTIVNSSLVNSRVLGVEDFAKENYSEIKSFLDNNLSDEQSFIDFSNTPILYYYCQRRVPSYFCQSLQNTVDDELQIKSLDFYDLKKYPVVVYSNYPVNWFDHTDGVPNSMRYYIIGEYIYRNYKPYGIYNQHSLWTSDSFSKILPSGDVKVDTVVEKPKTYNYKKSGGTINRYFARNDYSDLQLVENCVLLEGRYDGYITYILSEESINGNPVFARITASDIKSDEEFNIVITNDSTYLGTILLKTDSLNNEYMFMLSNYYLCHAKQVQYLNIKKDVDTKIDKIEIFRDCRYEY